LKPNNIYFYRLTNLSSSIHPQGWVPIETGKVHNLGSLK